ncbi:MAG: NAD(P)H-dependent oxidoreductase, partial [Pseudomonadota bacterium]
EREKEEGIPSKAREFVRQIGLSDALIMSFAEHNGNVSVAFKNIFDWASRIEQKVYQARPMLMMATSPGARGGVSVLEIASTAAPFFEGRVFGTFSLPNFNETFDRERQDILDADKAKELSSLVKGFAFTLTEGQVEEE